MTLAGQAVNLGATELDLLRELSFYADGERRYEDLLRRVCRLRNTGDTRVAHGFESRLRSKLGEAARSPAYIPTEPRVGYRMPKPSDL